ncbi:GNAT family N-acetyltransferase [Aquiluna sp.]|nr:GNAT family N-acetyltransferase [Aquiluna sp.]
MIHLRPLVESDATLDYVAWLRDTDVNRFLEVRHNPPNQTELKTWIRKCAEDASRQNFAVLSDASFIGTASILAVDKFNGTFQTGWMIGNKSYWGGKTSLSVMAALFDKGFADEAMRKCFGRVFACHAKARIANRAIGMIEEARITDSHLLDGEEVDTIIVSITRQQWLSSRNDLVSRLGLTVEST